MKSNLVKSSFEQSFPALYKTVLNTVVMFVSEKCGVCLYKEDDSEDWFVGEICGGDDIVSCYNQTVWQKLMPDEFVQLRND